MGEEREPPVAPVPGTRAIRLPAAASGRLRGLVLADVDVRAPQLLQDRVGDLPLLPGRTRDLAEPHEAVEHALIVGHDRDRLRRGRARES